MAVPVVTSLYGMDVTVRVSIPSKGTAAVCTAVVVLPGNMMASYGGDGSIILWNVTEGVVHRHMERTPMVVAGCGV